MDHSRRSVLILGCATLFCGPSRAHAEALITGFTGGASVTEGGVEITVERAIADGHSVPITLSAENAEAIALFAPANPTPMIGIFNFGPLVASRKIETRIRLADSQQITAVARLGDGTFRRQKVSVTVAIGGCNT